MEIKEIVKDIVKEYNRELENLQNKRNFEAFAKYDTQKKFNTKFNFPRNVSPTTQGGGSYLPYGFGDLFDCFPQYLIYLSKISGSLKTAINKKSMLLFGNGFENETLGNIRVNSAGETMDDILKQACKSVVQFGGVAFKTIYNVFAEVTEVYVCAFENLRQSQPNNKNEVEHILSINNYEKYVTAPRKNIVDVYDIFCDDKEKNLRKIWAYADVNNVESFDYPGQIHYFYYKEAGSEFYPFPAYASVMQDCENEGIIKNSKKNDIAQRFRPSTIITKYGNANPTEEEKRNDNYIFTQLMGEGGAGAVLLYAQNAESKPSVDVVNNTDLSKSYEYAEKSAQTNIFRTFNIDEVFYSFTGKSDFLGDSDKMRKILDFTQKTELIPIQQDITRQMKRIFNNSKIDFSQFDFKIKNLSVIE